MSTTELKEEEVTKHSGARKEKIAAGSAGRLKIWSAIAHDPVAPGDGLKKDS